MTETKTPAKKASDRQAKAAATASRRKELLAELEQRLGKNRVRTYSEADVDGKTIGVFADGEVHEIRGLSAQEVNSGLEALALGFDLGRAAAHAEARSATRSAK